MNATNPITKSHHCLPAPKGTDRPGANGCCMTTACVVLKSGMPGYRSTTLPSLEARLFRCRSQALRLLDAAQTAMTRGRWNESEELLWGSLVAAARGVALWHGAPADSDDALRGFLHRLGEQERDRYIRDAFDHLSALSDAAERVRERRSRVDYLFLAMDDLTEAIERLVARIPGGDNPIPSANPDDEVADFN